MRPLRLLTYSSVMILSLMIAVSNFAFGDEEQTRDILKQGLLGAGVGAISAGASGGKAGQGALIGAGTSVIGSALLDAITGPSASQRQRRRAPPSKAVLPISASFPPKLTFPMPSSSPKFPPEIVISEPIIPDCRLKPLILGIGFINLKVFVLLWLSEIVVTLTLFKPTLHPHGTDLPLK